MNVLLTGASGLVGSQVAKALKSRNDRIISVTRGNSRTAQGISWNPLDQTPSEALVSAVQQSDAIIHLAGENIANGRWNEKRKAEIRDSRICSTGQISSAINAAQRRARVFLCASAVGYYGNRGGEELDESSPPGEAWLSEVCQAWENRAAQAHCRVVHMRFGVILSNSGGVLPKMIRPFQFGLGGTIGKGNQWMSWVAIEDVVRAILYLLDAFQLPGPVNIVAPEPVTNKEFSRVLAKVLHRPALLRVSETALRLLLGEMADELLLSSQRVRPGVLERSGFQFQYRTLETSLTHLLKPAR